MSGILGRNFAREAINLAVIAFILTVILWYMPTFQSDFVGKFMDNWVTLVAFSLAVYWAIVIKRRTPL